MVCTGGLGLVPGSLVLKTRTGEVKEKVKAGKGRSMCFKPLRRGLFFVVVVCTEEGVDLFEQLQLSLTQSRQ